jgi:hypothetical protein
MKLPQLAGIRWWGNRPRGAALHISWERPCMMQSSTRIRGVSACLEILLRMKLQRNGKIEYRLRKRGNQSPTKLRVEISISASGYKVAARMTARMTSIAGCGWPLDQAPEKRWLPPLQIHHRQGPCSTKYLPNFLIISSNPKRFL